MKECMKNNPDTAFMVENVVMNTEVAGDAEVQGTKLGADFGQISPTELGWPQMRTRRVAQNVVDDLDMLERKTPFDPNILLEPLGYITRGTTMPCVMASMETHEQMMLWDIKTGKAVEHVIEAAEVMQGYQPGISEAYGTMKAPIEVRQQMVGNAFHASFVQAILRNWKPAYLEERARMIMSMTKEDVEDEMLRGMQTPLEKKLKRMCDKELGEWMDKKLVGYQELKLSLEVKDGEAPAQFPLRLRYQTPQKLNAPVMAAIREKLGMGSLNLVKYNVNQWISPMFVKPKGRVDQMTGLELLSFLTDFRAANKGLQWNEHWVSWMPTLEDMRASIPRWARWFWPEDIKDAFEHVVVVEEGREKLTVAPPIKLTANMFTHEELRSWGYIDREIDRQIGQVGHITQSPRPKDTWTAAARRRGAVADNCLLALTSMAGGMDACYPRSP